MLELRIKTPEAFSGLFSKKRNKVYYGGRGAGKSTAIVDALLLTGISRKIRVLCAREIQKSIEDSVHKLIGDRIDYYGLGEFYKITKKSITGINGTEFIFKGLKHNSSQIKSTEGLDYCWVEEAENVSDNSWELLIPTIRKNGSELWVSFNPKNVTDPTYQRFIVNTDEDTLVVKVSYRDNPWFPDVLEKERLKLQKKDMEAYLHVWEGEPDTRHSGSIYAKWIDKLYKDGRHVKNLYDPTLKVFTAWDLGWSDSTSIWFFQVAGKEPRIIDCYENNTEQIEFYCDVLADKGYEYGEHYAPADAANKLLAAGGRSIVQMAQKAGVTMTVIPETTYANRHQALRELLNNAWFDEKCKDGIHALMNYKYEFNEDLGVFKKTPVHDWSSHYSTAAELMARVIQEQKVKKEIANTKEFVYNAGPNGTILGQINTKAYFERKARERRND